ncbi:MAG: hypothetical protein QG566_79 [Patescibacteria group bacterium]|nr:hypothetical protein [Patescibacteria group bacterium]
MQNIIPIIKDFLYSAFIAILPTVMSFLLWEVVPIPSRLGVGGVILVSFLVFTFIIFITRRQNSKKIYYIVCLVLLLSMPAFIIYRNYNNRIICEKLDGKDVTLPYITFEVIRDIDGDVHSGDKYGMDKVCYITSKKLKEIDPKASPYKWVDFVVTD